MMNEMNRYYRGITILNVVFKVLNYCILGRIKPIAEETLRDYQGDFKPIGQQQFKSLA